MRPFLLYSYGARSHRTRVVASPCVNPPFPEQPHAASVWGWSWGDQWGERGVPSRPPDVLSHPIDLQNREMRAVLSAAALQGGLQVRVPLAPLMGSGLDMFFVGARTHHWCGGVSNPRWGSGPHAAGGARDGRRLPWGVPLGSTMFSQVRGVSREPRPFRHASDCVSTGEARGREVFALVGPSNDLITNGNPLTDPGLRGMRAGTEQVNRAARDVQETRETKDAAGGVRPVLTPGGPESFPSLVRPEWRPATPRVTLARTAPDDHVVSNRQG